MIGKFLMLGPLLVCIILVTISQVNGWARNPCTDSFHDEYGADVDVVKKAIEKATYDWTTFEDSDCFKDPKYKTLTAAKPGFC